jgi:hypothetical protein
MCKQIDGRPSCWTEWTQKVHSLCGTESKDHLVTSYHDKCLQFMLQRYLELCKISKKKGQRVFYVTKIQNMLCHNELRQKSQCIFCTSQAFNVD